MVSRQAMSIGLTAQFAMSPYRAITAAMPETMAEKMNTIGIRGVDHHGLALTEPKMKPT